MKGFLRFDELIQNCQSLKKNRQKQNGLRSLAGDHCDLTEYLNGLPVGPRGWQ